MWDGTTVHNITVTDLKREGCGMMPHDLGSMSLVQGSPPVDKEFESFSHVEM